MRLAFVTLSLLLISGCCLAAEITILDDFKYPDVAAARAAWVESMGGVPAELFQDGDKTAVKIMCPFATKPEVERGSLDKAVTLDLSRAGAITFDFYCDDPTALSYCAIYFHSGEGWYGTSFGVDKGWNHLSIGKGNFHLEQQPAGWDKIDTIRISAWRGKARDTFCALANLQTRTEDVAVVSGVLEGAEGRSANQMAKQLSDHLARTGVPFGVLTDTDVELGALAGQKVAIFAYSPRLSEKALEQIKTYVESGGKIMFFYSMPQTVADLLGLAKPVWRPHQKDDDYATVAFNATDIPGLPASMAQNSWNITSFEAGTTHNARVIATWRDGQGQDQGPAVLLSDNGAFVGHVLTEAEPAAKQAFLMALVGHFVPDAWQVAASGAVAKARQVGPFKTQADLDGFLSAAQKDPVVGPRVKAAMAQAAAAEKQAQQLLADKQYPQVQASAQALHDALAEAYLVAHRPRTAEFRAVWNHSGTGDCGTWEEAMKLLKAGGFNAVVPNMWWGGLAHYDSKLLPLSSTFAKQGDQIAQCVAAGKKYGIEVHPWKVNWNLSTAPKEFVDQMRAEGRLQATASGAGEPWLCPSHPKNFELERDTMLEVVRNYDVDGVHFDYIRYPGGDNCYCDGCRERFEAVHRAKVANWPADCYSGALKAEYRQFRCDQITRLVKAVSEEAHRLKPHIKISAAVFASYPRCKDDVGQDWVLWCHEGWLDFVCPMDYAESNTRFSVDVTNQLAYVGNSVPLYAGIGAFINTDDNAVAQADIARTLGADGFILFNMGKDLAVRGLPKFAKGITSEPAILPHNGPQVRFVCPLDAPGKTTALPGGELSVKVEMVSAGGQRQKVTAMAGRLEIQDVLGKRLLDLGDLPKVGKSADVKVSVSRLTGMIRLAAVGTMAFADGTKAPFVVRSRPYLLPPPPPPPAP